MTRALALLLIVAATPASAHPGHFAEIAGHSHWIALGALAAAGLLAAGLLGKKTDDATDEEEIEAETEEAQA